MDGGLNRPESDVFHVLNYNMIEEEEIIEDAMTSEEEDIEKESIESMMDDDSDDELRAVQWDDSRRE